MRIGLRIVITLFAARFNLFQQPVEITLEQPVLHDAIFLEFAFGMGLGDFRRDLAGTREGKSLCTPKKPPKSQTAAP